MKSSRSVRVYGDGMEGTVDLAEWPLDGSKPQVLARCEDGREVMLDSSRLVRQEDGSYRLAGGPEGVAAPSTAGQEVVVPVVQEELAIGKRVVETGRVRVRRTITTEEQIVDEPLLREEVTVERIPLNQLIETAPPVRHEGEVLVVPVVEEVLVVARQLVLKEELRITRAKNEFHQPQTVTTRSDQVSVERLESGGR